MDDWPLESLMTFDAEAADLEDRDDEPGADDEEDSAPVVVELVQPEVIARGRRGRVAHRTTARGLTAAATVSWA